MTTTAARLRPVVSFGFEAGGRQLHVSGRRQFSGSCGIVGLPNVGKSTLFNARTQTQSAEAANYPFCTIEPNVAKVAVSDPRLRKLAHIAKSAKTIPMQVDLTDIAGLVKGASQGAGLGNKFLGHVRSTSAILQVVRCYEDTDITHVDDSIDPVRDLETIGTELMLADLESVERRLGAKKNKKKLEGAAAREAELQSELLQRAYEALQAGVAVRAMELTDEEARLLPSLQLLSAKPMLVICNVDEDAAADGNHHTEAVAAHVATAGATGQVESLAISAKLEMEISELGDERERAEYLAEMGLASTGLERILQASTRLLGLQSFYTVGPTEARSWSIPIGCTAASAAGVIHSDMQRGFIKAETIAYDDYVRCGGEEAAKKEGLLRVEGKDYVCRDGDVFHFRFNV